jgi:hypothetical protein
LCEYPLKAVLDGVNAGWQEQKFNLLNTSNLARYGSPYGAAQKRAGLDYDFDSQETSGQLAQEANREFFPRVTRFVPACYRGS